jgi:digeranylgeranylglycerophospholipid reductase
LRAAVPRRYDEFVTCDIIVIGAGPAGSRAAAQLAGRGRRVLVLERAAAPGHKTACTGLVSMECARAFDIPDDIILRTVNSARLFSPCGEVLRVERAEPQAAVLDRSAFDALLAGRARDAGAELLFSHRATGISLRPDAAVVSYDSPEGSGTLEARAVVLASGYGPNLVGSLGLGEYRYSAAGAQAEVTADIEEVEVYFGQVAPKFFGWLVPAGPGRARVGLLSRDAPGPRLQPWLAALADAGRIVPAEADISYGRVPLHPLRRTYRDRLLVVGDAAGQVKPITGGGIYFGLLAADLAAETLHRAFERDDFSVSFLRSYERSWREKLGRELRRGYRVRKAMEMFGDRFLDSLFRWAARRGVDRALADAGDLAFDRHARALGRLARLWLTSPFRRRERAVN